MASQDKIVVITGASSGIGEAAARLLADRGCTVVLGARRMDRLAALADEINDAGGTAVAVELDVTSRESMDRFIGEALDRFGRIDVLVNNAGLMILGPLCDGEVEAWDHMIDVNLRGVLHGIAAALPHMLARESGHMILIGSTSGHRVSPMGGIYCATKFALRAIADTLRMEGGANVRSTLISPSATQTEIVDHVGHAQMEQALRAIRPQALEAGAVARAIAYAIEQPPEVDVSEILIRPTSLKD